MAPIRDLGREFGRAAAWLRELAEIAGARTMKWGALAIATAIGAFLADLVFALALQRFLSAIDLIPSGSGESVFGPLRGPWAEGAIFLAAGVVRVGLMWINGFATGVCSVTFESNQRRDIAHWALDYGRASLGEFTTLFNDVVVGAAAVASNTAHLASRVVLIGATLAALGIYSWPVTLLIIALVVMVAPLQRLIDRRLNTVSRVLQRSLAEAVNRLVAGVKNSVFLQIHGLTAAEAQQARSLIGSFERSSRAYYLLASARNSIPQLTGLVVIAGIAVGGAQAFGDDRGRIVAYLYLALRLFQSLSEMARVTANMRVNLARYDVLRDWRRSRFALLSSPVPEKPAAAGSFAPVTAPIGWRLDNVSFGWTGTPLLLDRLSLSIEPATATVIVGPSGAGKTSLLLLLAGVLKAGAGRIDVVFPDGIQPVEAARSRLLPSIAFVGPDPFVVPGSLREFLVFGLDSVPAEAEIARVLRRAHCEFALSLGLEHRLTEQGEGLSAGQKQRLSLARALLRSPKALLLDEPTANLDAETEAALVATIGELKRDCTIVAVTHSEALRRIADKIVTQQGPQS